MRGVPTFISLLWITKGIYMKVSKNQEENKKVENFNLAGPL